MTATIALVLALGGSAVAASYVISQNSQLGPRTVAGSAPPSGKHANVIPSSITGFDLKPNSVGSARILDKSLAVSDLAASARPPIGFGAADNANQPICSADDRCPLAFSKNVIRVVKGQQVSSTGRFVAYCIRIRGATPAKNLMIAGQWGYYPNAGALVSQKVHAADCLSGDFQLATYATDGHDANVGFWFVVF